MAQHTADSANPLSPNYRPTPEPRGVATLALPAPTGLNPCNGSGWVTDYGHDEVAA